MTAVLALLRQSVFRHRAFGFFITARLASQLASGTQSVAIAWYLYDTTESALALGMLGLVQFLPGLGLVLVTGLAADRFNRRIILMLCWFVELLCVSVLIAFALFGTVPTLVIYVAMFTLSAARAFEHPTSSALLPNLVPEGEFPQAVAWSGAARQYGAIVGPVIGGVGMVFGPASVFGLSASLFGLAIVCLMPVRSPAVQSHARRTDWMSLFAGFKFIGGQPLVLGAISLDLFAVVLGGATALMPIIVRDVLEVGPWALGVLRSGPSIGAFLMTTAIALRPIRSGAGRKMFWAVAAYGLATVIFGLSTNFWLSLGSLAALGAADAISVFVRQTLVQLSTPDDMRGRVSAVNSVFISTSNNLGDFEAGVLAAWVGAVPAIVIGGVGTMLITWLWSRWFPQLVQVDTLARRG